MKRTTNDDGTMTAELTDGELSRISGVQKLCNELAWVEKHTARGKAAEDGDNALGRIIGETAEPTEDEEPEDED